MQLETLPSRASVSSATFRLPRGAVPGGRAGAGGELRRLRPRDRLCRDPGRQPCRRAGRPGRPAALGLGRGGGRMPGGLARQRAVRGAAAAPAAGGGDPAQEHGGRDPPQRQAHRQLSVLGAMPGLSRAAAPGPAGGRGREAMIEPPADQGARRHVGTTRETAARALGQLAKAGIARRRGRELLIRDLGCSRPWAIPTAELAGPTEDPDSG